MDIRVEAARGAGYGEGLVPVFTRLEAPRSPRCWDFMEAS